MRQWNRLLALVLAALPAAAPLQSQPLDFRAPPLPDLRVAAIELDEVCQLSLVLENAGRGELPRSLYRRVQLRLRLPEGAVTRVSLARVDPGYRLQHAGGRLRWESGMMLKMADSVAAFAEAHIDAGGAVRESDETNNRLRIILRCAPAAPVDAAAPPKLPLPSALPRPGSMPGVTPETSRDPDPAGGPVTEAPLPAPPFPDEARSDRPAPLGGGKIFDASLPPPPGDSPDAPVPTGASPIEPGEAMAISPDMAAARNLADRAAENGLRVKRRRHLESLGLVLSVFRVPTGMTVAEAVATLRGFLPDDRRGLADANHRYRLQEGAAGDARHYGPRLTGWRGAPDCGRGLRLGLIDTPVDGNHPDLAGAGLVMRRFITTGVSAAPPDHGTALAARLVGELLPAARLYAASAFRQRDGVAETTAEWLLAALAWLAEKQVHVVNLSFAGPRNGPLEIALERILQRGIRVAAAAGNDGPGAPPRYPAAQAGVTAVTAVDAHLRVWRRAARGPHIDFSAPGVDLRSARAGGGHVYLSGTSHAVPFAAAALALEDPADLRRRARDLGPPGRDDRFGWGLVRAPAVCAQQ